MVKILSQAGTSLADVYNVEGSVGAIDQLRTEEVQLVHEMGGQIHSERLTHFNVVLSPGAVNQSTGFSATATGFPDSINRLLGVLASVPIAEATRLDVLMLAIVQGPDNEMPIWWWDSANDVEFEIRFALEGAVSAAHSGLQPLHGFQQTLLSRTGDTQDMASLIIRGVTTAFGAGTVTPSVVVHALRPDRGAPGPGTSSYGLPLPSW